MLAIREMRVEDIPASFAVRFETVENRVTAESLERDYGITPASLAAAMAIDVRGWICEDDGQAVGYAMGDRSTGEVQVVAVLPGYEGRGIGRDVLARVRDWLFAAGHDDIWLWANSDPDVRATGFYRRLGWRITDQTKGHQVVLRLHRRDAR